MGDLTRPPFGGRGGLMDLPVLLWMDVGGGEGVSEQLEKRHLT